MSAILKTDASPANFDFQSGSIAENALPDMFYYYAKLHAFTPF